MICCVVFRVAAPTVHDCSAVFSQQPTQTDPQHPPCTCESSRGSHRRGSRPNLAPQEATGRAGGLCWRMYVYVGVFVYVGVKVVWGVNASKQVNKSGEADTLQSHTATDKPRRQVNECMRSATRHTNKTACALKPPTRPPVLVDSSPPHCIAPLHAAHKHSTPTNKHTHLLRCTAGVLLAHPLHPQQQLLRCPPSHTCPHKA